MTLERHSVYLVPPRSSITSSSTVDGGGGKNAGEGGGASQNKDGQDGTGIGSVVEASPPTVVKLRILNAAASTSTSMKATTTHRRKSHFVSWKMSAPSISTIGTQQYALSTEFPALLPPSSSSSIASENGNGRRSSYATTASSNDAGATAGSSGGALSQYSTRVLNPATCPHKQRQQQVQPAASSPSKEASAANTPPRTQQSRSPSRQRVATERTDSSATTVNLRSDASTSSASVTSSPIIRSASITSSLSGASGRNSVPPSPAAAATGSSCSCQTSAGAAKSNQGDSVRQALSRSSSFAQSEASSHFPPYNGSIVSSKAGDEDLRISLGRPYEREYESIIVANAVQPTAGASAARKNGAADRQQQNYMNSGSSVPILRDTPGLLLGKHEEEDVFAVTRTNSVLMRRKDLQWYLDKMLWKLGVHKKARRDFMAYWLPRFRNEEYVAIRFLPSEEFSPLIPFEYSSNFIPPSSPLSSSPSSPKEDKDNLPLHRVLALFRRVSPPEVGGWTYIVKGGSSTQGVIDWSETCRIPEGWAVDERVPLLLEVGALDTGGRSYFFD